jgi:hypothetical protein
MAKKKKRNRFVEDKPEEFIKVTLPKQKQKPSNGSKVKK